MNSPLIDSAVAHALRQTEASLKNTLICFCHLRWHLVTQRPQHLMMRAARNRRVFFWEEPIWHHAEDPVVDSQGQGMYLEITEEAPNLWIVRPHMMWGIDFEQGQRTLFSQLVGDFSVHSFVAWYYNPMALAVADQYQPAAVVYDCMDELSAFLNAPLELTQYEKRLFQAADAVFTGGISLYEAKRLQHKNVHAFPSSIEVEHFRQAKSTLQLEPVDQLFIPAPRAGFYGVIDERFDVQLLARIAHLLPEVHFVILGPIVKIDASTLPTGHNIHYLGSKKYEDLPAYLSGWDVALLLFARNKATRFISPTKTPEYLAAGKTVVSTSIHDVIREYGDEGLVAIADDPEEFTVAIRQALEPQPETWKDAVEAKLATNSWDSTWNAMEKELDKCLESKQATNVPLQPSVSFKLNSAVSSPVYSEPKLSRRYNVERYDYVVVGAGFAGSVLAERLASQLDKRVLVIDKRDHIAGNAFDVANSDGILIHQYGPHIFHTNSDRVVRYLSQFTKWRPYEHRVLSSVDQQLVPIPINLDTINILYKLNLDDAGMKRFLDARCVVSNNIKTSEELVLSRVGRELYEKFFRNYTIKQWGLDPSQLDAGVAGRIPVRFDRDDRYFTDDFQAMPLLGYTRMFERILDHPRITVKTGVNYGEITRLHPESKIIYTGPIDEYFGFRFGALPYRSLRFQHETHNCETFQSAPVVNYPNEHAYTRITEFKYLTGQKHPKTSIVYEFPTDQGDPYYPIPRPENAAIYRRYSELANSEKNVIFCGRLANYKYLNMDQVVAQALATFTKIEEREISPRAIAELRASPDQSVAL